MYLCICKAVTDRQIHQAVTQGARTMGEITTRFGIGIECGKCIDDVKAFLDVCLAAPPTVGEAAALSLDSADSAQAPLAVQEVAQAPVVAEPPPQRDAWFAIDL
ncbi:MAG: (2Fe-2S)-binding protein [Candidatus Competibacteraceae bacterium]|nr:(2Fe-2S)-binding protein [Candidatus Competibacteraceae bacterium]